MTTRIFPCLILSIFLGTAALPVAAQVVEREAFERPSVPACGDGEEHSIYPFAVYLFEQEHWEQAVTEFQRFRFFCPDDPRVPGAMLSIGNCYERLEQFSEAIAAYRELADAFPETPEGREAGVGIGETYYRAGKYEEARIALQAFLNRHPPVPWAERARYRMAWASLHLHAFAVAEEEFSGLAVQGGPYRQAAEEIAGAVDRIRELPYRSPVLAGVLSGVLPGAGQLYAGETKDALLSFLVNGALIFATYESFNHELYGLGGVVSVVTLSFYAGNIYGAVNSAHHANRDRLTAHLSRLKKMYEWYEAPPENRAGVSPDPFRGVVSRLLTPCARQGRGTPPEDHPYNSFGSVAADRCIPLRGSRLAKQACAGEGGIVEGIADR